MSELKIGNYQIETEKAYNALKSAGVTSSESLSQFDANSDMVISEDELVDFIEEAEEDETESSSSSSSSAEKASSQLKTYEDAIFALENNLRTLYSSLSNAEDVQSILDKIASVNDQIDEYEGYIYDILVADENKAAAAAAAAAAETSSSGTTTSSNISNLTTGSGISSGTTDFGSTIVSTALSYVGKLKESDGSYLQVTGGRSEAWCADFVTYVVSQAASETGTSLNGFGSPSVSTLKAWGEANNCYGDITGKSSSEKAAWIAANVQPGDVMIMKSNGASHTGIVTKVYSDGSFDTVEGNTSDQCLERHYTASEARLSGFIDIT